MSTSWKGRARGLTVAILALVFSLVPGRVSAHAEYERSEPAAGATVSSPARLDVWFSQELFRREGENALEVTGPDGARVDVGSPFLDDADRTHLSVELAPDLAPGLYTVRWRTLSATDGDPGEGEFSFTVDPSAPAATQTPTAPPENAATAEAPGAPTPSVTTNDREVEFPWWLLGTAGAIVLSGSIVALIILRDGEGS